MEQDDRLKKDPGVDRRSREVDDRRIVETRELTDDDRLEMFRQQLFNNVLPDLPAIPGYHVCWLTTTNPGDTIHARIRLGYEPVKATDIPGMEFASVKTGEYAGCIGINEMVAFKLPMSLYQAYMKEARYTAPIREEGKLKETAEFLREQATRDGGALIESEGFRELQQTQPAPRIFEGS